MAKIALSLKINTSEIDMARLYAGKKGSYLDATIFVELDELDQYGNSGMITQDVSKEERAQGVKGNILGNGKIYWVENGEAPKESGSVPQQSFQQAPAQQAPQQAPPKPMAAQPAPMQAAPQAVDHSAIIGQYKNLDQAARTALWTTLQPAQQTAIIEALG